MAPTCACTRSPRQTGRVNQAPQAVVAARIPGAAALGLVPPPGAGDEPGRRPRGVGEHCRRHHLRGRRQGSADRRVLATVWWYSASTVLLTPPLAGLVAGVPLSGRLEDISISLLPGGLPAAAVAAAGGKDLAGDVRDSLAAVITAVAEAGRMRERPLWAIATDSLANQLLTLGRALGDVRAVTAEARPLAAAIGAPLPEPRYVDVAGARFTRRASCCLMYLLPGQPLCTSCPRRAPAERQILLEGLGL
jgi:ferric iron reductase protein FhuF